MRMPDPETMPDPTDDMRVDESRTRTCAERILCVMEAIGNVPKDDYNEGQSFHYRGVEKVVAATRDAMIEYRLLCLPIATEAFTETRERTNSSGKPIVERIGLVKQTYSFINADDDADSLEVQVVGESIDSGDKALSKAMTAAHKVVLLQSFQIGDNKQDQDSEDDDAPASVDLIDEATLHDLRMVVDSMNEQARAVLRAAWRRSWGNLREGTVPAAMIPEISDLLDAMSKMALAVAAQ